MIQMFRTFLDVFCVGALIAVGFRMVVSEEKLMAMVALAIVPTFSCFVAKQRYLRSVKRVEKSNSIQMVKN